MLTLLTAKFGLLLLLATADTVMCVHAVQYVFQRLECCWSHCWTVLPRPVA